MYAFGYMHGGWLCAILSVAAFWFVIPGHGLIYGPHLWILGMLHLLRGRKLPFLQEYTILDRTPHETSRQGEWASNNHCPICDKPLRSNEAQQCFECGADWHGASDRE